MRHAISEKYNSTIYTKNERGCRTWAKKKKNAKKVPTESNRLVLWLLNSHANQLIFGWLARLFTSPTIILSISIFTINEDEIEISSDNWNKQRTKH